MKLFYLRDRDRNPVACVASQPAIYWNGKITAYHFALSIRNPIDQYNKEVARCLAAGRVVLLDPDLGYGPLTGVVHGEGNPKIDILKLLANGHFPKQVMKAAKYQLQIVEPLRRLKSPGPH